MKGFIFDFNGTLFPDSEMHDRAWKIFMARRGIALSTEAFLKYMCGPPNSVILRQFLDPNLTPIQIGELSEEKESIYRELVCSDPANRRLTPGADEMLDAMKQSGIPYAIATCSSRENVDFYFDVLGIGRWFTRDNVFYPAGKIPGKPDPAIYRMAMEQMGFHPDHTIVVEDSLTGVQSAIGAGIRQIIAIDASFSAEEFAPFSQIMAVIHDFHNFERFIRT